MSKVYFTDLSECWIKWVGSDQELRFGQAFLNEFFPSVVDPEVFYERNPILAYYKITRKYVNDY